MPPPLHCSVDPPLMSLKDARQLVGNIADAVSEIVQYNLDNTAFEVCDYIFSTLYA